MVVDVFLLDGHEDLLAERQPVLLLHSLMIIITKMHTDLNRGGKR